MGSHTIDLAESVLLEYCTSFAGRSDSAANTKIARNRCTWPRWTWRRTGETDKADNGGGPDCVGGLRWFSEHLGEIATTGGNSDAGVMDVITHNGMIIYERERVPPYFAECTT